MKGEMKGNGEVWKRMGMKGKDEGGWEKNKTKEKG